MAGGCRVSDIIVVSEPLVIVRAGEKARGIAERWREVLEAQHARGGVACRGSGVLTALERITSAIPAASGNGGDDGSAEPVIMILETSTEGAATMLGCSDRNVR
jgi:hypothetical protein